TPCCRLGKHCPRGGLETGEGRPEHVGRFDVFSGRLVVQNRTVQQSGPGRECLDPLRCAHDAVAERFWMTRSAKVPRAEQRKSVAWINQTLVVCEDERWLVQYDHVTDVHDSASS